MTRPRAMTADRECPLYKHAEDIHDYDQGCQHRRCDCVLNVPAILTMRASHDSSEQAIQREQQKVADLVSHCDVLSERIQRERALADQLAEALKAAGSAITQSQILEAAELRYAALAQHAAVRGGK